MRCLLRNRVSKRRNHMYQLKDDVLSQRALGDSGVGVMGHWGDGAREQMLQRSNTPMLQYLFFVSEIMLENQLSRSLTLKLIRMGIQAPQSLFQSMYSQ